MMGRDGVGVLQHGGWWGWEANLEHAIVGRKVTFAHRKGSKWSTEGSQPFVDERGVVARWPHQHIEIFGRAGVAVKGDGVTAKNDERGASIRQLYQQVSKVIGEIDHGCRRATKPTGMSGRMS